MTILKNTIPLRPYVVCVFDLLNQREKLQALRWFPQDDDQMADFTRQWEGIVDTLSTFRKLFEQSVAVAKQVLSEDNPKLSREQNAWLKARSTLEIKTQMFSDSAILFTGVPTDSPADAAIAIDNLLVTCVSVFRAAISSGLVYRGGIEFGLAVEMFEDDPGVYGPALYHAYMLENTVAGYPRIVVGPNVPKFVKHCVSQAGGERDRQLTRIVAETCLELVTVDNDGWPILHYASTSLPVPPGTEFLKPALGFAQKEWRRFLGEGNHKLAQRYFMLTQYLEGNMPSK